MKAGSKVEEEVWNEFANDRSRLKAVADAIKATGSMPAEFWRTEDDDGVDEAAEGRVLTRLHRIRERSRELVQRKKQKVLKETGQLACEVCSFDFTAAYGSIGSGFIECHHTVPLSTLEPGSKTTLNELALICANCHRMLHRGTKWLTVDELRRMVQLGRR